ARNVLPSSNRGKPLQSPERGAATGGLRTIDGLDRRGLRRNNRGSLMVPEQLEWLDSRIIESQHGSLGADPSSSPRDWEVDVAASGDRLSEPISRIVGVYQIVLRRTLEHFFPGAQLEVTGDRSIIDWVGSPEEPYYRVQDDSSGLGVEID